MNCVASPIGLTRSVSFLVQYHTHIMQTMLSYVYILYLPTSISCDITFGCIKHYHIEVWNIFVIGQKMNVEYVKSNQFQ